MKKNILIITWAKGHYDSIRGRIFSDWKIEGKTFLWEILVPVNTTAEVYFLIKSTGEITEGGRVVPRSKFKQKDGRLMLHVGSGTYAFAVQNARN